MQSLLREFISATIATSVLALYAGGAVAQSTSSANLDMTMLTGKVDRALQACSVELDDIGHLTMAQVVGITLADSSDDDAGKCQKISAIAN